MAELKTKPTQASVKEFLNQIPDKERRDDCIAVAKIMEEVTGDKPKMWGPSIVGFGTYHYKYASGREGESMLTGFSPRKQALVLYLGPGLHDQGLRAKLGTHKAGEGCLYLKKLEDVDRRTLRTLVAHAVDVMRKRHPDE